MATALARRAEGRGDDAFAVDPSLPTPLYHQIYLMLRSEILSGAHPSGTLLPGETELTGRHGVSRITARRALNELAAAGLVVRERGRGTRVSYVAPTPPVRSSVEGLLENLVQMGLKTEVALLDFGYVAAGEAVAQALACEPGSTVQRAVRVRSYDKLPLSHLTTFVPESIGRSFGPEDLATTPLLVLLERCGAEVASAEQTISATLADSRTGPVLGVAVGTPLLRIERIVYAQDGRPVEFITGLYRPDRYQYRMTLSRIEGGEHKMWSPIA